MSSHGSDIHFFKRIEEDTLRNGELRIPRSFVNKCWEQISNPVLLLLPDGAKWEVNWKKLNIDVWLIDKWNKFAEFYSLDQDHLLVFRYVGNSQFQVVILNQSGLEMGYPMMEGTLDGEEVGNSLHHRKRAKSPLPYSRSTKKVKTNPKKEPNSYPIQEVETKRAQSRRTNAEPKKRGGRGTVYANRRWSKSKAIQNEGLSALERANAFRSRNPFFICEMHPSYIQKCLLAMPGNFIPEDQREEAERVTLWISERTWLVKFCPNRCSGQIILSTGWKNFVKENNLEIGNVCVFEKIKKPGISFRVFIFRDREESTPSMFPAYGDGANGSKQTGIQNVYAKRGSDGIPKMSKNQFTLSIKQNQFYYKNLPKKFFRNFDINTNDVTLRVGMRSWHVKLDDYGRFTSGWSEFMSECNLKNGDVCRFELIDKEKIAFKVTVTRCID